MKQLLKSMKERDMIGKEELKYLTHNFGGMAKEIFQNELKNSQATTDQRYTVELKLFVMTLHFYSPRAYDFVCKLSAFPYMSSIRNWASSVDCEPGHMTNVIQLFGKVLKGTLDA